MSTLTYDSGMASGKGQKREDTEAGRFSTREALSPHRLIGQGRAARVYDLGNGTVLRRYRNLSHDATHEAEAMRFAARCGVPVPVVRHARGPDLVMDRLDGRTMMADLLEHPGRLREHAAILAGLHRRLDAVPAPAGDNQPAPTDAPHRLLHGDLHPDNIILSPAGPVLIDWTNAAFGPAAHDVAQTWLVLGCFAHPDPAIEQRLAALRAPMLSAFLASVDRIAAAAALPVAAAARLHDLNTSENERVRIRLLLATSGPGTFPSTRSVQP